MKILKKVIVILILMLSILSVKSFASTGKINVDATRLRKENNTTSEILTNIYKDEEVQILEEHGEWIKIQYQKHTGYIKKEFVDIKESNNKENQESETKKDNISNYENAEQTMQNTNETKVIQKCSLKLIPSFMSKQIQQFEQGTDLKIVSQMNQWIKVTDGVVTGWVLKSKLDIGVSSTNVNDSDLKETASSTKNSNTINNSNNVNSSNTNKENKAKNNMVTNTAKENVVNNKDSNTIKENITNNNTNSTNQSIINSVSKKGKVNVETANVRKEPNTSSKRIEFLDEGDIVTITEETEEWYKVKHEDIEGYVSKKLITIIEDETITSRSLTEERKKEKSEEKEITNTIENSKDEQISVTGNSVVEYAKKYLGCSYVLGGKNPETGFDCSGFTRYVYKNFGYSLSSVSYEQANVGKEVTRENLQSGDLILFYNEGKTKIGHTGVYVGNGDFIHAANPERGVVYDNINTSKYYNERFVTARRIVE